MAKRQSRPFNVQLYRQRQQDMKALEPSADEDDLLLCVGQITAQFETCEYFLSICLQTLDTKSDFIPLIFDTINSRATRSQIIVEFMEATKPARLTKRYQRIKSAFEQYDALGKRRDEVAHSMVHRWTEDGRTSMFLGPPPHIRRKHVAGYPKFHYDTKRLNKLRDELYELNSTLSSIILDRAVQNRERLQKRALRRVSHKPVK